MEKILKLYTYVDGVHDTPFPNEEHQVVTSTFRSDYKRMGGAPTISCTIMHHLCLDKMWTDNVYATFNGEKFFIKQIPSSSFDNTDARYKHELELVSERFVLDNVYFYDVVDSSANYDKPVSNSSKFVFFGDIREFASRLNQSLQYSKVGYSVVVDDGIYSESKMVSFQDQFFSNAIQESYNTYNIPYYFVGKVIHFGYTNNAITHTFKYGQDESLLSIQKQNSNYKIVNRVTGVGSADNIPYYYPNDYESKAEVEANGGTWINPQTNLMPSIYRETFGDERFYKALNGTYQITNSNEYYEFANPYIEGKPKEHIVNFEDVRPTIKGMVNSNGMRIDMFQEFAYDLNDNDETDEEGNYLHPYFFAKLRRFDGEHGFNLFDHAIDEQEMTISMTSGNCGACEFVIGVDESTQKNTVQVADNGSLERDDDGNVKFGTPQDKQNDTINNEVWIALRKDIDTFGVIMPNATNNYKPSVNDTFVILHIDLPKAYILAAEDNLKNQLIEYMALNNSEKFNFSISFSRIFFAEHPDVLAQLNENARIQIEYDNTDYELYISSYSYSMSSDKPLPEIRVELSDTLTISQNALQTAINEIKSEIISSGGAGGGYTGDILKLGLKYFLRKDTDDRSKGKISTDKALEVGKFIQGASGAIIQVDTKNGQTVAELDKLYVRMKAYFETLEIINVNTIGGKMILSPAGSVTCLGVEELDDAYRCYFLGEQDGEIIENRWEEGMQAYAQMFNAKEGVSNKVSNTYYWRLVTGVSEETVAYNNQKCHYIDLSKTDCALGSDIPNAGDVINHRGCRNDVDYMNFIEFSSVGTNAPYITLFQGVNSYSLTNKEYVSFGYDQSTGRAYMNVYGDMFFGNRDESSYIKYNPTDGLEVKGKLSVGTTYNGSEIGALFDKQQEDLEKFTEAVTKEFENIRNEMDGAIDTWFGEEQPTLGNYPAVDWTTNEMKDSHLGDLFYTNDGKAYRFQYTDADGYYWAAIEDSEVVKALELAQKALDTADGKRRVFVPTDEHPTPYPPYDKGDLWARGSEYPLMRCIVDRGENGTFHESDWALADDTHSYADAIKEELEESINATKSELDQAIANAEAAAKDYTDEGKAVLQQSINQLNEAKANVNDVYTKAQADDEITKAENDAIAAAKAQADAAIKLSEETTKAYADGEITKEEEARIKQAAENLAAAKQYAEEKANEAFNNAMEEIAGYEYLKQALKEDTTIEGGLIQSSLIKLGYTGASGYVVMAGSNGTLDTNLGDKSIAFWAGGDMLDRENGSNVSNAADFLVRMDGSGYAAGGNLSWDVTGKITADPMSFFVGEDTVSALLRAFTVTYNSGNVPTLITPNAPFGVFNVSGATTLASTLSVTGDITAKSKLLFGDIPMYKSQDGVVYIEGNLVVQGGITMYGTGSTDVPSIIDSLPTASTSSKGIAYFDSNYFSVASDGKVSFIGATGGLDVTELQNYLTQNSYLNVTEGDGRYLKLNGGKMTGDIEFGLNPNASTATTYALLFKSTSNKYLYAKADELYYGVDSSTKGKIWHSSNDGSGSGLDADLLDGNHLSDILASNVASATKLASVTVQGLSSEALIYKKIASISLSSRYAGRSSILLLRTATSSSMSRGNSCEIHVYCYQQSVIGEAPSYSIKTNCDDTHFRVYGVLNYSSSGSTLDLYVYGMHYLYTGIVVSLLSGDDIISIGEEVLSVLPSGTVITPDKMGGAYSATKLNTTRTIWGQSFDGTNNVNGDLIVTNENWIVRVDTNYELLAYNTTNKYFNIGYSTASREYSTYLCGYDIKFRYGTSATSGMILDSFGNVGIGILNPKLKLEVGGSARFSYLGDTNNYGGIYVSQTDENFSESSIQFEFSDSTLASAGYSKTHGAFLYDVTSASRLIISHTDGLLYHYINSNKYRIWTANDFNYNNYLPLSGGTMSGVISFPKPASPYKALAFNEGEYIDLYGNVVLASTSKAWNVMNSERQSLFSVYKEGKAILGPAAKIRPPKGILDLLVENTECNLYIGSLADNYTSINFLHSDEIKWQISSRASTTSVSGQSLANSLIVYDYDGANWTNRFTITKSGYIGINNYNPSEMLHLKSSSACKVLIEQSANGALFYQAKGVTYALAFGIDSGGANRGIYDLTNGGWMMYRGSNTNVIFPNGNIGLGTASPTHRLHLYSTGAAPIYLEHNYSSTYAECFNAHNSGLTSGQYYSLCIGHSSTSKNRGVLSFYYAGNGSTSNRFTLAIHGVDNILNVLGTGNVGIGTTSPSYKLHVVGNTYLNGDVYVDDLNTYDIIPRATESYSCGSSGSRWYQVYSYIGNFSGAVNMGSTLNVTGATTMSNATLTGDLRLKDSTDYGRTIYFGDGSYCYLKEATDDVLTIYASKGIAMNTSSTSYNVSMNTNLLVSGGITMYNTSDQRKKKNIRTFNASQELMSLGGVYQFEYNDDEVEKNVIYKGTHVGLIYQNVKGTILDKMCYEREDGYGALNYLDSSFISLIAAVEIEHETRIQKLERENKLLREEVERLKAS